MDEAGQLDLEHFDALLKRVQASRGLLVVIGDLAQRQTIGLAAQKDDVKLTVVHRMQGGSVVEWQAQAIARGGEAIRSGDRAAAKAYFLEYADRGHFTFCATPREQVYATAAEVVRLEREGTIALLRSRTHKENLQHSEQIDASSGSRKRGSA